MLFLEVEENHLGILTLGLVETLIDFGVTHGGCQDVEGPDAHRESPVRELGCV